MSILGKIAKKCFPPHSSLVRSGINIMQLHSAKLAIFSSHWQPPKAQLIVLQFMFISYVGAFNQSLNDCVHEQNSKIVCIRIAYAK